MVDGSADDDQRDRRTSFRPGDPDAITGAHHAHPALGEPVQGAVRSALSG